MSSSRTGFTQPNTTPFNLPFSWMNSLGGRLLTKGMRSSNASSFSQSDAFITSNAERTTTVTDSAPKRLEVRQQSMAVLPPPITITLPEMECVWPKATLPSQSMPMEMCASTSRRPGKSKSRPRGAPVPTK